MYMVLKDAVPGDNQQEAAQYMALGVHNSYNNIHINIISVEEA